MRGRLDLAQHPLGHGAAVVGRRRARELRVDEVARDLGDELVGREHGGAADASDLLAGEAGMKRERAVDWDDVQRAQQRLALGVRRREVGDARAPKQVEGLVLAAAVGRGPAHLHRAESCW